MNQNPRDRDNDMNRDRQKRDNTRGEQIGGEDRESNKAGDVGNPDMGTQGNQQGARQPGKVQQRSADDRLPGQGGEGGGRDRE